MASSYVVVSKEYCTPVQVEMVVKRGLEKLTEGDFNMRDANGKLLFTPSLGPEGEITLLDRSYAPVLTLQKDVLSFHGRWNVYRGKSTEYSELLYTVKRSAMLSEFETEVDVFLGHNTEEEICDFKVRGTWLQRSCTVYAGESNTVVAELEKKDEVEEGVDNFVVTVYPNVDYAFMASLTVILDHLIRKDRDRICSVAKGVARVAVELHAPGASWFF